MAATFSCAYGGEVSDLVTGAEATRGDVIRVPFVDGWLNNLAARMAVHDRPPRHWMHIAVPFEAQTPHLY